MWHVDHMATRSKCHPGVNRAELARKINFDRGYLTRVLNGTQGASLSVALAIFRETGLQFGPLEGKSKRDISMIERAHELVAA